MSDLDLCALAAASYSTKPNGIVVEWQDLRAVVTDNVVAIRGTVPDVPADWFRDMEVAGELSVTHPTLGHCAEGALHGAEGLFPLLVPHFSGSSVTLTGHSLGGQIAVILAGLLVAAGTSPAALVTWDAPKAGGEVLAALLAGVPARQFRFRGSVVSSWPLLLDRHVREPLIPILPWVPDLVEAHSINRALAWMRAQPEGFTLV